MSSSSTTTTLVTASSSLTSSSLTSSTTATAAAQQPDHPLPWSNLPFLQSLLLPIIYLFSLFGFLYSAAQYYKKKNIRNQKYESGYFAFNRSQYEYDELSEQFYIDDPNGVKVLTIALMKRAMESVRRVLRLQQEKPPLQQMVREGVIGEKLWEKLLIAEQEVEQELKACMEESNLYKAGWDATFVQEASQLVQMQMQVEAQQEQERLKQAEMGGDGDGGQEEKEATSATSTTTTSPNSKKSKNTIPNPEDMDDAARERLAQELIDEEEREAAKLVQQQKNKQKKAGGAHSKQNSGGKRNSTGGGSN